MLNIFDTSSYTECHIHFTPSPALSTLPWRGGNLDLRKLKIYQVSVSSIPWLLSVKSVGGVRPALLFMRTGVMSGVIACHVCPDILTCHHCTAANIILGFTTVIDSPLTVVKLYFIPNLTHRRVWCLCLYTSWLKYDLSDKNNLYFHRGCTEWWWHVKQSYSIASLTGNSIRTGDTTIGLHRNC